MRALLGSLLLLLPGLAQAKPWKGLTPGESKKADIVKKFGEPSKRIPQGPKEMLAYNGDEAIKGSRETEFIINDEGVLEQIAVFPATPVEKATIAETFGPDCATTGGKGNCFIRKMNEDDYKTYYWYKSTGLVVFFKEDGNTVQSFLYVPPNFSGDTASSAKGEGEPKGKKGKKEKKPKASEEDEG